MKTTVTTTGSVLAAWLMGVDGRLLGAAAILLVLIVDAAIFSDRAEPAERLIDLARGRAPRDPPSTTSTTRGSRSS